MLTLKTFSANFESFIEIFNSHDFTPLKVQMMIF